MFKETHLKNLKYLEQKIQADDEKMIELNSELAEKQSKMNELKVNIRGHNNCLIDSIYVLFLVVFFT